jgi:hypothetical protein
MAATHLPKNPAAQLISNHGSSSSISQFNNSPFVNGN